MNQERMPSQDIIRPLVRANSHDDDEVVARCAKFSERRWKWKWSWKDCSNNYFVMHVCFQTMLVLLHEQHSSWVAFTARLKIDFQFSIPNSAVCPDPGVPAKGRRLDDDFMDGKTVRFVCNRNHDLLGNRTIKCIGGAWSANPPECKGKK